MYFLPMTEWHTTQNLAMLPQFFQDLLFQIESFQIYMLGL